MPDGVWLGRIVGQGVRYLVDQVFQLLLGLLQPVIDRARAGARDQVDLVHDLLRKLGIANLTGDQIKDRTSLRAGLPNHAIHNRVERPDVAGTVHQARPEEERGSRQKRLHAVICLRIGQVGKFGSHRQVIGRAIPQLGALGVFGAGREAPLDANAE